MLTSVAAVLISSPCHAQLIKHPRIALPPVSATVQRAVPNSNEFPAGRRDGDLHRISIDIVESAWRPEGVNDPELAILAFAETGRVPVVPGPLIRVREGTAVLVTLRNRSDSALIVGGLRPGTPNDTVHLAPGSTRDVRSQLDTAGTYYYWGAFAGTTRNDRLWKDSQLNGALVVDAPGAATHDRILVLSEWFLPHTSLPAFEASQSINGKAWPHSPHIQMRQGDSMRLRVINTMPFSHPMHLHGFYYRIESRGDGARDIAIHPDSQFLSNTDQLRDLSTMTLSFTASRPGNWLFHCHLAFHTDEAVSVSGAPRSPEEALALVRADSAAQHSHTEGDSITASSGRHHSSHSMRGLVMGVQVEPLPGYSDLPVGIPRELQLYVGRKPGRLFGGATAIGFSLRTGDSIPARDSLVIPGPVLELRRGEPVRIVVNNQLDEPTSVHWHGLEIESFPDGVPNYSGLRSRIYTQVAPRDSFVAMFTPTRSGTYPYHSHLNDRRQIQSGLYGALIVTDAPRDLTRDHLVVAGGGGPEVINKFESPYALVNGRLNPRPLTLESGITHRLRLVSIHPDWFVDFSLRNDSTIARWRAIAKDGAEIPTALATLRPANVRMGPGETADFEFTPPAPGQWRLEVHTAAWYIVVPVIAVQKEQK